MLKCVETDTELSPGQNVFAASRHGDPESFALSPVVIDRIPKNCRRTMREKYKTGGVNIYKATIAGKNGDSALSFDRDDSFEFSIPMAAFQKLLKNTSENFRFPTRPLLF